MHVLLLRLKNRPLDYYTIQHDPATEHLLRPVERRDGLKKAILSRLGMLPSGGKTVP